MGSAYFHFFLVDFSKDLHCKTPVLQKKIPYFQKTENIDEQPAFKLLRKLESVNKVYRSEDLIEGATSFVGKKTPKWK